MTTELLQAFSFAKDVAIQFITISSAIIGVTITFLKDFERPESKWRYLLVLTWLLLFASIFFGYLDLLSLTGTLAATPAPTEISDDIRSLAFWQESLFGAGMLMLMLYGLFALIAGPRREQVP
jgi:hypothetical protein